jgi:hypothetical protein
MHDGSKSRSEGGEALFAPGINHGGLLGFVWRFGIIKGQIGATSLDVIAHKADASIQLLARRNMTASVPFAPD